MLFCLIILPLFLINPNQNTKDVANSLLNGTSSNLIDKNMITYKPEQTISKPTIFTKSPKQGSDTAPIKIFEYSSFGCEFSNRVQPIIDQLLKKYPNQIQVIWKDYPINKLVSTYHLAARCAQEQGKFWEYANLLNKNSTTNINTLADNLKLSQKTFADCLKSSSTEKLINNDINEAEQLGIYSTPFFYVNDQEISGLTSVEDFERIIKIQLDKLTKAHDQK